MSNYPRRSARLSPHLTQDQAHLSTSSLSSYAHFSPSSSTSTSSHPSPISDTANPPPPPPTPQQPQRRLQVPVQQTHLHAPLPSPSAADMDPFFGRAHSQPNPYSSQPMHSDYSAQQSHPHTFAETRQQQPPPPPPQQQHHPHTHSMSPSHAIHGMNPGQLPPGFLAEAAKRAQIACLMRDLGDITL